MEKSKDRQELEKAIAEITELRKPKVSKEVIDAVVEKIKEDELDEKVARPNKSEEVHINL